MSKTTITIEGDAFYINGHPTYQGRYWHGHKIEGLLLNTRMVQATFDDANPTTASRWAYPDTGRWNPERNLREFIDAMPLYRDSGVLALTLNLQGGSPEGYSKEQPWNNFFAALSEYCSWGYFDPGKNDYQNGYQSVPTRWDLNTECKKEFFALAKAISGWESTP